MAAMTYGDYRGMVEETMVRTAIVEFREPDGDEQPIERSEDLGLMLLDLDYAPDHSGRGTPIFFNARLENGVLLVPALNPTTGG